MIDNAGGEQAVIQKRYDPASSGPCGDRGPVLVVHRSGESGAEIRAVDQRFVHIYSVPDHPLHLRARDEFRI